MSNTRKLAEFTSLLKDMSEEYNIPIDRLMVGIVNNEIYLWDYDEGRAFNEKFKVLDSLTI